MSDTGFACTECGTVLKAETADNAMWHCANRQCHMFGVNRSLGWVLKENEQPAAGWPRPVAAGPDGRMHPVPWLTPVHDTPLWKNVNPVRERAAIRNWLCQVCGLPLPEMAWVAVDTVTGDPDGPALHERCMDTSQVACPHLAPGLNRHWLPVTRRELTARPEVGWSWAEQREHV